MKPAGSIKRDIRPQHVVDIYLGKSPGGDWTAPEHNPRRRFQRIQDASAMTLRYFAAMEQPFSGGHLQTVEVLNPKDTVVWGLFTHKTGLTVDHYFLEASGVILMRRKPFEKPLTDFEVVNPATVSISAGTQILRTLERRCLAAHAHWRKDVLVTEQSRFIPRPLQATG